MSADRWVWCLHCQRCFIITLNRQPNEQESVFDFGADFEMQLGEQEGDTVYAYCYYEDCTASLLNFHWWSGISGDIPGAPETPIEGIVYERT